MFKRLFATLLLALPFCSQAETYDPCIAESHMIKTFAEERDAGRTLGAALAGLANEDTASAFKLAKMLLWVYEDHQFSPVVFEQLYLQACGG